MTVSKFMAIQEALQPDWFQCLSDGEASCAETTSIKRARKSVDRSLLFLDSCLRLQEESEVRLPDSCGSAHLPSAAGCTLAGPRLWRAASWLVPAYFSVPCISALHVPVSFAEAKKLASLGFHLRLFRPQATFP
jgi:hypothetical protein